MTERIEQMYCITFCQKLVDTQVETIRKIQQAFGNEALSNGLNALNKWRVIPAHKTSRKEEVIDQIHEKVLKIRRLTVLEIVAEVGISTGSLLRI